MKLRLPFPYWLWEEIVLTLPPHNRISLFRFIAIQTAVVFSLGGFSAGRQHWGLWAGILMAIPLAFLGFWLGSVLGYLMLRWSACMLRFLVRRGVMAEPEFRDEESTDERKDA